MEKYSFALREWKLIVGDLIALALAVFVGLQFHQLGQQVVQRFAFTFLPWTLAWLTSAPAFGLFDRNIPLAKQIGRVLWVMALASPLAVVLRAAWLGTSALPLFALIMGAASALAIILWRLLYFYFLAKHLPSK